MTDTIETTRADPFNPLDALIAAWPAILFGIRLTGAVSLALFIAFYLQLENPSWAGTSAAIVCQPVLGASMRKGIFRLIGTTVGAVATVLLTAVFPQDRLGFLLGMALWCGACSFVSTLLRNFAAYAAMLAGYTMVIIASSSVTAPDQVFTLALARATEIGVGIVCGMAVMSLTDSGGSAGRLASAFTNLVAEIGAGVLAQVQQVGAGDETFRTRRRDLIKQVVALDPLLDQTIGEVPAASVRRTTIRTGIQGLFLALSAWRTLGTHLARLPEDEARRQAQILRDALSDTLVFPAGAATSAAGWDADHRDRLVAYRDRCFARATACRDREVDSSSLRLGVDRVASVLEGLGRAANAAILLVDNSHALPLRTAQRTLVPDVLPALVNAARVIVAIAAGILFWVATSWPAGLSFITFLAVTVMLLSPRDEAAFSAAVGFGAGMLLTTVIAGLIKFAVLPNHESFASFAAILAIALVPMAALSTRPELAPVFIAATANFIPLLGPANEITYDTASFYNSALAIGGGSIAGAVILRIIPPVPRQRRTARLVGLSLRDFRRLAKNPLRWRPDRWRSRIYGRILALPADSDPIEGSRLLATLTVGLQLIELHEAAERFRCDQATVRDVEQAFRAGEIARARDRLKRLKESIATWPPALSANTRQRLQGSAREISETLSTYGDYFGAEIR